MLSVAAYLLSLVMGVYGLFGLALVALRFVPSRKVPLSTPESWPEITTQLPLFNEALVAERLLRSVAAIHYPKGLHRIQVLDDSTDETREIVDRISAELREAGALIQIIRREDRTGFKAGALAHGLLEIESDYVAIFDADFTPPADFITRLLPALLASEKGAFAQARWGHLNPDANLLTRAQVANIDGHFHVQQFVRARFDLAMNFNGSAGIWRRAAIEDAGGWKGDTLTEDMDLSHRAALRGWRAVYDDTLVVPAELPETPSAYRAQQFRWAKGSTQTLLKLAPELWHSGLPPWTKFFAILHEAQYIIHPLLFLHCLTAPLILRYGVPGGQIMMLTALATLLVPIVSLHRLRPLRVAGLCSVFLLGSGIAWTGTRAFLSALFGRSSEFVRTPKTAGGAHAANRIGLLDSCVEIVLGTYAGITFLVHQSLHGGWSSTFLLIHTCGFLTLGIAGLRECKRGAPCST